MRDGAAGVVEDPVDDQAQLVGTLGRDVGALGGRERRGLERHHDAVGVRRIGQHGGVQPGVRRRVLDQLGPQVGRGRRAEVGAEPQRELGGDHPVGTGGAGRRDLLVQRRHPTLEVGGGAVGLGDARHRQDHVGLTGRGGQEAVERDHGAGPGDGASGEGAVGDVDERIGAQQHQHVDPAVGRGASGCRGRRVHAVGGRRPQTVAPDRCALGEAEATRQHARGPGRPRWRRARCRVAARTGTGRRARASRTASGGVDDRAGGLGEVRSADHHPQVVARGADQLRRRDRPARRAPRPPRRRAPGPTAARRPARRPLRAGTAATTAAYGDRPERAGASSTMRDAVVLRGVAEPQVQDRQLLLGVGPEVAARCVPGAQTSSMVAPGRPSDELGRAGRRRAGRRRGRCRARPWPAWPRRTAPRWSAGHRRARRSTTGRRPRSASAAAAEGVGPRRGRQGAVAAAHVGLAEAVLGVDGLEAEAALVAEPAPVHRVRVDALVAQHLVAAGLRP